MRSIYHIREYNVRRLSLVSKNAQPTGEKKNYDIVKVKANNVSSSRRQISFYLTTGRAVSSSTGTLTAYSVANRSYVAISPRNNLDRRH